MSERRLADYYKDMDSATLIPTESSQSGDRLVSIIPPAPRLPSMPTEAELQAALSAFDRAAEIDTARRLRVVQAETVRPNRIRRSK